MRNNGVVDEMSFEPISPREAQVLDGVRGHLTNAEIAHRLHISVRTVESHVSALLRKTGTPDRRRLAALPVGAAPGRLGGVEGVAGLPRTWTTFVGRVAEMEELNVAVEASRLVTLVGAGGVGKTRLAVMAATRSGRGFPAGGAFVDLVPVRAEFVVEAVAGALGVLESPPNRSSSRYSIDSTWDDCFLFSITVSTCWRRWPPSRPKPWRPARP